MKLLSIMTLLILVSCGQSNNQSSSSSGSSTSTTEGSNPNSSFCDLNCGRVVKYKKDILHNL